jgi:hypothetical protein
MIVLNSSTRKLQLLLNGAITTNELPVVVHYYQRRTDDSIVVSGCTVSLSTGASAVDILAAPAAGNIRTIEGLSVHNADTVSAVVTIRYNDNATTYKLVVITLATGDNLFYEPKAGWSVITSAGNIKTDVTEVSQDAIGAMIVDSDTIDFTYTDATPSLTGSVRTQMSLTSDTSGIKLSADETSPGNLEVYGTNSSGTKGWYPTNTKTVYIPAKDITPQSATGCAALALVASGAGLADMQTLDFDTATTEYAQFSRVLPRNFSGTITAFFYWSHAATVTNFGVAWGLQTVGLANDDAISTAWGTAVSILDTGGTTDDLYISPVTSAMTIGNTHADNDLVVFRVLRDLSDGGDNLGIDARLHGIQLVYTPDAHGEA